MGGSKNAQKPSEKKKSFIIYQTKIQKLGSPKNDRAEKT